MKWCNGPTNDKSVLLQLLQLMDKKEIVQVVYLTGGNQVQAYVNKTCTYFICEYHFCSSYRIFGNEISN